MFFNKKLVSIGSVLSLPLISSLNPIFADGNSENDNGSLTNAYYEVYDRVDSTFVKVENAFQDVFEKVKNYGAFVIPSLGLVALNSMMVISGLSLNSLANTGSNIMNSLGSLGSFSLPSIGTAITVPASFIGSSASFTVKSTSVTASTASGSFASIVSGPSIGGVGSAGLLSYNMITTPNSFASLAIGNVAASVGPSLVAPPLLIANSFANTASNILYGFGSLTSLFL